jgi:hypothetical protein
LRNSDYRFGKKSCDNRDNHIQQEAIIVFREKLKSPFRINPSYDQIFLKIKKNVLILSGNPPNFEVNFALKICQSHFTEIVVFQFFITWMKHDENLIKRKYLII